jgi:hypothetical protein
VSTTLEFFQAPPTKGDVIAAWSAVDGTRAYVRAGPDALLCSGYEPWPPPAEWDGGGGQRFGRDAICQRPRIWRTWRMSVDEFRNRNDLDYSRWLADHSRG